MLLCDDFLFSFYFFMGFSYRALALNFGNHIQQLSESTKTDEEQNLLFYLSRRWTISIYFHHFEYYHFYQLKKIKSRLKIEHSNLNESVHEWKAKPEETFHLKN